MKSLLFLLLLFCQYSFALDKNIFINNDINKENFSVEYLHDDKNIFRPKDIISADFKTSTNHASFGINHNITWFKLSLENNTDAVKRVFLHNNFAYMSKNITVYEFEDKRQIKSVFYDLFDNNIEHKLSGSTLVYEFSLLPKEKKTLLLKKESLIHQLIDFKLYDKHASNKTLRNKGFYSNVLVLVLFSLALYNIILFFFIRRKEFAFYSLYLFNSSLGLLYMYGIIYNNLNLYGSVAFWFNLTAILVSPLLILFIKAIFDTKEKNKRINRLLNTVLYLSIIFIVTALFISLDFSIKAVGVLFFYTFIVLLYVGIYFYKKKHPLAKLFLLSYLIYIFGMGLTIYMLMGYTSYHPLLFHASGFGLVFEALLFSYLINYRIKLLEEGMIKHQNSLILKNKKAQMGEMIGAIAHQWKQPLNAISSVSTALQYRLNKEKEITAEYLEPKLSKINEKILFLVEIMDDFKEFFNTKSVQKDVNPANIINKVISLKADDMLANEIKIELDLNFERQIKLNPNELLHILLNLIQNSNEAFIRNKIDKRVIQIRGNTNDYQTIIEIQDNAGGIEQKDLCNIFEESFTLKEQKKGAGLGLYLCRLILKEQLNGTIDVQTKNDGTIFRIVL